MGGSRQLSRKEKEIFGRQFDTKEAAK